MNSGISSLVSCYVDSLLHSGKINQCVQQENFFLEAVNCIIRTLSSIPKGWLLVRLKGLQFVFSQCGSQTSHFWTVAKWEGWSKKERFMLCSVIRRVCWREAEWEGFVCCFNLNISVKLTVIFLYFLFRKGHLSCSKRGRRKSWNGSSNVRRNLKERNS